MKRILSIIITIGCIFTIGTMPTLAVPPCDDTLLLADALHELGLFNGTGITEDGYPIYDLDAIPTRQQAVVMLIRLLGKEYEALENTYSHPFTDVDAWADRYISYAYQNGLTNGISTTIFGGNYNITAQQYITFLLRALGYDSEDFSYSEALEFSDFIGLTDGRYSLSDTFLRRDIVWLSCGALLQSTKTTGGALIKELKKERVFTDEQYILGLSIMAEADLMEKYRYEHFNGEYFDMYNLYTTEGSGTYQGYLRLHGYPKDHEFQIYFTDRNSVTVYHNINMNQTITWYYNGEYYQNTLEECYSFFADTSKLRHIISDLGGDSSAMMTEIFGDAYTNWVSEITYGLKGAEVVGKYLDIKNGIYYEEPIGGFDPENYFNLFDFEESWKEQEIETEWISEWELQQLSGEENLSFGIMISSLSAWSSGTGNLIYGFSLQGIISKEIFYVDDMPESFARADNIEGRYSNINFKKIDGEWYFNPSDLITVGLLNTDGSFNTNYKIEP